MPRGRGLRRAPPTRAPKVRFLIYCEGENTEPHYFRALLALHDHAVLLDIVPVPGDLIKLAREAGERGRREGVGRRRRLNSFEEADQVWAVFDRDEHPGFDETIRICESNGVSVARSNPCFELWRILHEREFERPDGSRAVCRELAALNPEYDPNRRKVCPWDRLGERVEAAELRARLQLSRREGEGAPHGRPSTTVGGLTREIREAAHRATGQSEI